MSLQQDTRHFQEYFLRDGMRKKMGSKDSMPGVHSELARALLLEGDQAQLNSLLLPYEIIYLFIAFHCIVSRFRVSPIPSFSLSSFSPSHFPVLYNKIILQFQHSAI